MWSSDAIVERIFLSVIIISTVFVLKIYLKRKGSKYSRSPICCKRKFVEKFFTQNKNSSLDTTIPFIFNEATKKTDAIQSLQYVKYGNIATSLFTLPNIDIDLLKDTTHTNESVDETYALKKNLDIALSKRKNTADVIRNSAEDTVKDCSRNNKAKCNIRSLERDTRDRNTRLLLPAISSNLETSSVAGISDMSHAEERQISHGSRLQFSSIEEDGVLCRTNSSYISEHFREELPELDFSPIYRRQGIITKEKV